MLLTKQKIYWLIIKKQIQIEKTLVASLKRASSNLLVDKIKSIVAFKFRELVMVSKNGFPYSNVWVKEESIISDDLQSIFLIVSKEGGSIIVVNETVEQEMFVSTSAPHLKRRGEAIFFAPMGGDFSWSKNIFSTYSRKT